MRFASDIARGPASLARGARTSGLEVRCRRPVDPVCGPRSSSGGKPADHRHRAENDKRAREPEQTDGRSAGLAGELAAPGNPHVCGIVRRHPTRDRSEQGVDCGRQQRPGRDQCDSALAEHTGKLSVTARVKRHGPFLLRFRPIWAPPSSASAGPGVSADPHEFSGASCRSLGRAR